MKRMSFLLALALTPGAAAPALFKCVADDGHVTYRDTPCATDARPLTLDPAPSVPAAALHDSQ